MADTPNVRNTGAKQVLRELKEAGIASDTLMTEAGLQMYQLNRDEGWIPYEGYALLMEAAAREMADPCYGMNLARRIDPRDYGALAYIGLFSATLEDALLNLERYLSVQTEAWALDLDMQSRSVALRLNPSRPDFSRHVQAAEAVVATMINAYQFFLAEPLVPQEVHFVHTLEPDRSKVHIEELLGCAVQFNQNRGQVILDRKSLLLPIGTADDRLLKILTQHCEQVLKDHEPQQSSLVTEVRQTIATLLPSGRAKADTVANELGLTRRTMHRRLAEQGGSFRELHDTLCRNLAKRYIAEENLNFQQVAFLLGYADQSAFSVAFKRWTGLSPKDARAPTA
jgi:AraC-like DNA-binding protein